MIKKEHIKSGKVKEEHRSKYNFKEIKKFEGEDTVISLLKQILEKLK